MFKISIGIAMISYAISIAPAHALPTCAERIATCKSDCYARGATNNCPRRCDQKLVVAKDGRKFIIWNEFAHPDDKQRQSPSKWRREACQ